MFSTSLLIWISCVYYFIINQNISCLVLHYFLFYLSLPLGATLLLSIFWSVSLCLYSLGATHMLSIFLRVCQSIWLTINLSLCVSNLWVPPFFSLSSGISVCGSDRLLNCHSVSLVDILLCILSVFVFFYNLGFFFIG